MNPRLLSAQAKAERAKKHVDEFDIRCRRIKQLDADLVVCDVEAKTGKRVYRLKSVPDMPAEVGVIAGDAIHNLRTALEYLAQQLFEVGPAKGDSTVERKIGFPFADSKGDFRPGFVRPDRPAKGKAPARRGEVQVFTDGAIKTLNALEPYKAGKGEGLWVLSKLDNCDKHRILVPAVARFGGVELRGVAFRTSIRAGSAKCPLKPGDELLSTDAEFGDDPQFSVEVAFHEPGIIEAKAVLESLHDFTSLVEIAINELGRHL